MTLFDAITTFIQAPLKNILTGLPGFMFMMGCTVLLWWFGIHGTQTLKGVYEAVLLQAFAENEAAYLAGEVPPNIINTPFMSVFGTVTGAGITGGLLIAILLFSKRDDYRSIAKLAIPCAIFNINEPIVYGAIVFNPLLMIPMWLNAIAVSVITYLTMKAGLVTMPYRSFLLWYVPEPILPFMTNYDFRGVILVLILMVINAVIWYPFLLIYDRQCLKQEEIEKEA